MRIGWKRGESLAERFWGRVEIGKDDECWLWKSALQGNGYGHMRYRGKFLMAHRTAWVLAHGLIPEGMYVCHHCDNRACVNPAHLFLGTAADNSKDMVNKGRAAHNRGGLAGAAKLTLPEVLVIRKSDELQRVLADRYNVSPSAISLLKSGKTWSESYGL